ncbi:MAG: ion transporter [Oscillatoriaceae cyanobacterium Prado104]|jgi:voltage-gated sodium channel|nr:ion transporter [Oscillatoriaceae cyanobacterium Prado104]
MLNQIRKIVDSTAFQLFIIAAIIVAGVLVGLETVPEIAAKYALPIYILDRIIIWIFVGEFLLKLAAEWPKSWRYFGDGWNILDFAIVVACFLPIDNNYVLVIRMVRLLRVLKLLRALPKLQLLVSALLKSLPSMGYVALLMTLLFYIYGVAGTFMFGKNDPLHFGSLGASMLSLFKMATLEGWIELMDIQVYGCDRVGYDGGLAEFCQHPTTSPMSPLFFVTFIMLGAMIVINLLVGVMITSLEEANQEQIATEKKVATALLHETESHLEEKLEELHKQLNQVQTTLEIIRQKPH